MSVWRDLSVESRDWVLADAVYWIQELAEVNHEDLPGRCQGGEIVVDVSILWIVVLRVRKCFDRNNVEG